MTPTNLRAQAAKIPGVKIGMEFEMYVPDTRAGEEETEYDYDGYISTGTWGALRDDLYGFFTGGEMVNGRRWVQSQIDRAAEDFNNWLEEQWYSYAVENFADWWEENHEDEPVPTSGSDEYDTAMEEYRDEEYDGWVKEGDKIDEWLTEDGIDRYSEFGREYGLDWPYTRTIRSDDDVDIDTVASDFSEAVGIPANVSSNYHGKTKSETAYTVEPDSSLSRPHDDDDAGLEFVSPPLSVDEMIDQLKKVRQWADDYGCYTNSSTGLHINVSMPGYSIEKLDYVKLALFIGDDWVSKQFGRLGNTYAESSIGKIRNKIRTNPDSINGYLTSIKSGLATLASKIIHSGQTQKYVTINTKDNRIEFRSPGGDWLNSDLNLLVNTMLRFIVAMDIALDPAKERDEYAKKLYKLISTSATKEDIDTIKYFSLFSAGTLPKSALASYVRKIQQKRQDVKNPPKAATAATAGGTIEYWIVRASDGHKVHEFLAKDVDHAIEIKNQWAQNNHEDPRKYIVKRPIQTGEVGEYRITYESPDGSRASTEIRANSRREAHDEFVSTMPGYRILGFEQV